MKTSNIQTQLRRLIAHHGVTGAARQLGIQRETLARLVAGLPVRHGTLLAAEKALASIFGEALDR